ncbi:hypothetical protein [Rhizobium binae]|uniref:hypothetical protein n=1 Tax=Rhizobium binae TaxID=1138190 RepID=UPI001C83D22C|nr:hypothetical protein [Rhizobium binae]MBX4967809.1 hypothetical protein [Rhizobium binae]
MNTYDLASGLLEIVPTAFRYRRENPVLIGEGEWRELPTEVPQLGPIRDEASLIVRELDTALKHNNWRPDRNLIAFPDPGLWSLGSVEQRAPIRKIHLGYLEPIRRFPVIERVPELVVAFLTKIPGWDDYVKREYHPGVGWHYHYLSDPRKRSDVLIAWDTRWQPPAEAPDDLPPPPRPLFGEKHGEGKADFSAKPWLWGDRKKESMHDVCAPDLKKWPIHEFRCASNHAEPVWPSSARLTSMHVPVSPPAKLSGKKKQRR